MLSTSNPPSINILWRFYHQLLLILSESPSLDHVWLLLIPGHVPLILFCVYCMCRLCIACVRVCIPCVQWTLFMPGQPANVLWRQHSSHPGSLMAERRKNLPLNFQSINGSVSSDNFLVFLKFHLKCPWVPIYLHYWNNFEELVIYSIIPMFTIFKNYEVWHSQRLFWEILSKCSISPPHSSSWESMTSLFPERHAYLHLNALSAGKRGYKQGPVGWQGRGKGGSILSKKTPEDPKQQPLRCRSNN